MLEKLRNKHLFTSFVPMETSALGTRKKITIFNGVDEKQCYHLVITSLQQSRFIYKHAVELGDLLTKIVLHVNHNYAYKHLLLSASLCSKAKQHLEQEGWRVYQ